MKCPKCSREHPGKCYKIGEVPWWVRIKWWVKFDVLRFKRPVPTVHRNWIGGARATELAFGRDRFKK